MKRPSRTRKVRFRVKRAPEQEQEPETESDSDVSSNASIDGSHPTQLVNEVDRPASRKGRRRTAKDILETVNVGPTKDELDALFRPKELPLEPPKKTKTPEATSPRLPHDVRRGSRSAPAFDHPTTRKRLEHLLEPPELPVSPTNCSSKHPDPAEPEAPSLHPLTRHQMSSLRRTLLAALEDLGPAPTSSAYPSDPSDLLRILRAEHDLYQSALSDVIRESTVSMRERGLLLHEIRERYKGLFEGVPKHLDALYTELGRLRGIVGGSGVALEGVRAGLERIGRGLGELKSRKKAKKVDAAGVLEKLASVKEIVELWARVHGLEVDRDEWTRRASGLGPRDLHLLAESLRVLLGARCELARRSISSPLDTARPLLIELSEIAGKFAVEAEKADAEDLEALRSVERETARLGALLTARLESKEVDVEAKGANTAAMFARRDLVPSAVELRSWVKRLRGVVTRRGEEPKRAAYLLARLKEEIDAATNGIRALESAFPSTKAAKQNEALTTASIWLSQQSSRALGADTRLVAIQALLPLLEIALSNIDGIAVDSGPVAAPVTAEGIAAVLGTRRELARSMMSWSAALHPIVSRFASGSDGEGRKLVDGRAAVSVIHEFLVDLSAEARDGCQVVDGKSGDVWRAMCEWTVRALKGDGKGLEEVLVEVSLSELGFN